MNMEKKQREELIAKYNEGLADPTEIKWIEQLLSAGEIDLTQLRELAELDSQVQKMASASPSIHLDNQFYAALANEKKKQKGSATIKLSWSSLFPRLAFSTVLILVGFSVGYFVQLPSDNREVSQLNREVSELKEMVIFSLLEKESAAQRLKAVSLTSEMDQVSQRVTTALLTTLNQDENVNVRLAALDALKAYAMDSSVRSKLIESIAIQDSPLVQIALAELMVSIQEKRSVDALKKVLQNDKTTKEVKTKISESIEVLI
jgi:D-ribose pyranose/furanose isomerase RbsD